MVDCTTAMKTTKLAFSYYLHHCSNQLLNTIHSMSMTSPTDTEQLHQLGLRDDEFGFCQRIVYIILIILDLGLLRSCRRWLLDRPIITVCLAGFLAAAQRLISSWFSVFFLSSLHRLEFSFFVFQLSLVLGSGMQLRK